ncbi:GNAT family N-acetyltransferase [Roseiarcaceae bacterium H3SJ34-1]|uniref:GNAT family N-acetyltransferase n=1 Tax=Terripilifer ovatus TaxID=3032367 RepID=UPI003AB942D7|nr:GNAT family N-acetyltransferase [Roseiarcaceae bacterium H3SJ34-1]
MGMKSLPFGIWRHRQAGVGALHTALTIADLGGPANAPLFAPLHRARESVKGSIKERALRPAYVELLDWEQAAQIIPAWEDLARRALDRNIFVEPAFAASAAQHFPEAQRPAFLIVRDPRPGAPSGQLIGLCPVHLPSGDKFATAQFWRPPQMALGTPLLDRTLGLEALDLLHQWIAVSWPNVSALMFRSIPDATATARLILSHAHAHSLPYHRFDMHNRAVLTGGVDSHALIATTLSTKRRKELRRQYRRLGDRGVMTYVSARAPEDVRNAIERFLALEARGWKGSKRTALLSDPSLATFTRTMTRLLAHNGKCWVDAIEIDGAPIAMGIVLFSGENAFFWKIAYDESLSSYSPGVHLTIELTHRLAAERGIKLIDSCAIPDHPMIDRLWPDRMPVTDLLIGTQNGKDHFAAIAARETTRRKLRLILKTMWYKMRGLKAS